jgi:hypothetical protein
MIFKKGRPYRPPFFVFLLSMQPSARGEYLCKRPRLLSYTEFLLMTDLISSSSQASAAVPRRTFLRVAGASAATVGLVLTGCTKSDPEPATSSPSVLSFGTSKDTDKQVLNYLFFIKQLEYAFYDKVVTTFPADMLPAEQAHFRDLREHELVHRQVLANVLDSAALTALPFDFTSVSFTSRAGVLAAAKNLEDTAAAAFLGVLRRLKAFGTFSLAAKMSSVEARHAAFIRDLLLPGSFNGDALNDKVVDANGQALALPPAEVAVILKPFLPTLTINTDTLPTT